MAQTNNHAGIIHARDGYCDIMVRANKALSNGRSEVAIPLYTKILYILSPGDVCAFLNRSIAYVHEGYSELAVIDAYRASLAAKEMYNRTRVANTRLDQVATYIDAERLHVDAKDKWTRLENRNRGNGWLMEPLASIVVNALPSIIPPRETPKRFTSTRASLCKALEIRATYRLCGALSMLSEGARMDALRLIDNIKSKFEMAKWEARCFDKLGNDIMLQLVAEVDPWEPNDVRALGHDTKEARDERMRSLKETMRAGLTSWAYGDYSWDHYEPKLGESKWARRVQTWVEAHSRNCSAMVIQPEDAADTVDDLKPYVELRAKADINPGEIILSVLSIANLTTSIPEQVEARRHAGFVDHYYCNSCASLLVVPRECTQKFEKRLVPSTGASLTENSEPRSSASSSLAPSSPRDFMFCHPTHMVPTCSATCRGLGRDFDNGLCHTNIEQKLRQSHFNDINPRSETDCNTQCLRDLILLRLIARAINLGKNPLGLNDIMFATSGPDMRDIEYEDVEHWSFVSHVVRPLRYLSDLFRKNNTDQFRKLAQVDGWILNTLLVKINRVMNVSQTPRYVKCFRPDGMLDTAFGPDDDRWTHVPTEPEDQSTWIASIDSLVCLIGIADPAKGETPNVTIVRREGVHVYAAMAIKAGEPLLRAGNVVESPPLAEVDEAVLVREALDRMDEMGDAEEPQDRTDEMGDAEEPQDRMDESSDAEEEHSGPMVDLEQFFEGMDEEELRRGGGGGVTGGQGSGEVGDAEEQHSGPMVDLEQFFAGMDEEELRGGGGGGGGAGEEGSGEASQDAMVVDEGVDGDGDRDGHDFQRRE